jgi:hypothetical protein
VWAWGINDKGQLGNGTTSGTLPIPPTAVMNLGNGVKAIAAGAGQGLALTTGGVIKGWGDDTYGQLGDGTVGGACQCRSTPVQVSTLSGVTAIAAGQYHSLAIVGSPPGTWTWGRDDSGQLGDGVAAAGAYSATPVQVSGLAAMAFVAGGSAHSLASALQPTVAPTPTPPTTPVPTAAGSATPTSTAAPTATAVPFTSTPTPTNTFTPTATFTASPTPTGTLTPTATPTATSTPTPTPTATQAPPNYQAIGYYAAGPSPNVQYGAKAQIETADPRVAAGDISWVRTAVQYNPNGGPSYFAEIGWMKHDDGSFTVHITSTDPTQPAGTFISTDYPQYAPSVGSTHGYQVLWNPGASAYDLFYDGIFVAQRAAFPILTRVSCGGETLKSASAMGISGCLNNQYATNATGSWANYPSKQYQVNTEAGYAVVDLATANSWQVRGNN